ncbi:MAG: hypothetical protein U0Q11_18845 [Vicinamibacterales bacterium]
MKVCAAALGASVLLLALTSLPSNAAEPSSSTTWDAAAAQYLDARMDSWWANAKVLNTGDAQTRCISCHTAVPYALARPVLRHAAGQTQPTSHEERIAAIVKQRVESSATRQPFYDNSEDKKRESRGVESVLNALVLAVRDADEGRRSPRAETAAALEQMWSVQRADGSWDWLNFGLEPYEAPDAVFHGAALAAIAAGTASNLGAAINTPGNGAANLRGYLTSNVASQRLFNQAWALLAAARLDGALSSSRRDSVIRTLKNAQRADGGWSMNDLGAWHWDKSAAPFAPPGTPDAALLAASDGYATGLMLYALRQSNVPASDTAIVKGRAWLTSHQQAGSTADPAWAPWRAHSLNHDREHGGPRGEPWRRMFMSDLATAFAVLGLSD